jgi:sugar O-acyltransferase (sialic acid O-acetyltransferase NeuD family)
MRCMPRNPTSETPIVVVGAGGMGRCILDVVDAINAGPGDTAAIRVLGVVDDAEVDPRLLTERQVPFLGAVSAIDELDPAVSCVIGIADTHVRSRVAQRLGQRANSAPVLLHPNAHLGYGVSLGPGSVVCSHVSIETNVRIGQHVHINQNSTVGHDSVLSDFSTVSPMVAISGAVHAGQRVFFGTGSSIRQGLSLGDGSTVGMGAAVVADVEAGATVVGVPARPWGGG